MELGASVVENLCLAGDTAHIPDKCFDQLARKACRGVISETDRNAIADDPSFKAVDKAVLKAAYSGVVALVLEAAKHDADANGISHFLEECKFTPDRIQSFNNIFLTQKPSMQILLGSVGSCRPHIVDVDWRLDYYIKSNHMERINEAVYLISLKTEVLVVIYITGAGYGSVRVCLARPSFKRFSFLAHWNSFRTWLGN